jgi:hypothetical protein
MRWRTSFLGALLGLYPRRFRNRFGDEMLEVFEKSQEDASVKTGIAREALHLVGGAIREWWRAIRGAPFRLRRAVIGCALAFGIAGLVSFCVNSALGWVFRDFQVLALAFTAALNGGLAALGGAALAVLIGVRRTLPIAFAFFAGTIASGGANYALVVALKLNEVAFFEAASAYLSVQGACVLLSGLIAGMGIALGFGSPHGRMHLVIRTTAVFLIVFIVALPRYLIGWQIHAALGDVLRTAMFAVIAVLAGLLKGALLGWLVPPGVSRRAPRGAAVAT